LFDDTAFDTIFDSFQLSHENQGYQIYLTGNDWESQETVKLDANSPTEHTINSLRCGCKYQIYLVAFNEAGNSEPSEVQTFQTLGSGKFDSV
jgi:hypothetical protein